MYWDSSYAEQGEADRNIALRNRPDLKPAEERMNIVSNRLIVYEPNSNTTVRLESDLEARAMAIIAALPGCVKVRAQYHARMMVEGIWRDVYFDFLADFANGCRVLYAVRNKEHVREVEEDAELFRNQELSKHAHFLVVLTEDEISKPAVYRAEEILRARKMKNERNNELVMNALLLAGGRERVANVLAAVPGLTFASGWDALWSLIDRGEIVHEHPRPERATLKNQSWIRATEEFESEEDE